MSWLLYGRYSSGRDRGGHARYRRISPYEARKGSDEKKIAAGALLLLGLIYFVFGLNGLFNFLPSPPMPETAMGFLGCLSSSGYFLPVLAATQTIAGFLLLTGFAAPLALVILAPVTLQIFLFRVFLMPGVIFHASASYGHSAYCSSQRILADISPLFSKGT